MLPTDPRREHGSLPQSDRQPLWEAAMLPTVPGRRLSMIRAIVTDIEGTTSSLSFVKDVLFPYAREHLPAFIAAHGQEPEVQKLLEDVSAAAGRPLDRAQAVQQLLQWIAEDRKATPLKTLQGLIWEEGYRQGDYQGHIYDDAAQALRSWHEQGMRLYVYSSGSVHAQKLLFGHTALGDLTPLFSGYFDTNIGAKQDSASYRSIAEHIGLPANEILFLSDIEAELNAARSAGMQTRWLVREGELGVDPPHRQVQSFDQITP
jgi:enolase-phosphatase E1